MSGVTVDLFDRIVTMAAPGMTAADPSDGQPASLENSIFAQGFDGVYRTAGCKTAVVSDPGGDNQLINPDQKDERITKYFPDNFHERSG
jgi:hypothetical protein